ncbi:hypothetical protein BDV38DRAFT_13017 [Aspergillus pseudotamarii]|uniref:Uncharacterized protein n=1 Tax=Aspergillus pseudotamarii TaxID=132259 RepID=A0A5N6SDC2_ASPPS|nr:uncharacterized protein BDV38DRAFT_13017 [Aspergillus pseudotamarii]KAE8131700.1 hypothetical protein BDV38DRAFT_13017 [Aspergillus pseudotamarii]
MVTALSEVTFIRLKYMAGYTRIELMGSQIERLKQFFNSVDGPSLSEQDDCLQRLNNIIWAIGVSFMMSYSVLWHLGRGVLP